MTPRSRTRAASVGVAWLLPLAVGVLGDLAFADEQSDRPAPAERIVYVPPDLGAPPTRTLAAVRGEGEQPLVQVLAPEETGLTLEAQPTLYWLVAAPTEAPLEVTLIDEAGIEPLLEVDLGPARAAGLHDLQLAEHGIELKPDIEYRWSVAQVMDPAQRSADLVSSGTIRRALPGPDLAHGMEQADPMQKLEVLAGHGYWYDLIALLSAGIATQAENLELIRLRADLLEQVGLEEAAAEDRKAIGAQ